MVNLLAMTLTLLHACLSQKIYCVTIRGRNKCIYQAAILCCFFKDFWVHVCLSFKICKLVFVHGHFHAWVYGQNIIISTLLNVNWILPLFRTFCKKIWIWACMTPKTFFCCTNVKENVLLVLHLHEISSILVVQLHMRNS